MNHTSRSNQEVVEQAAPPQPPRVVEVDDALTAQSVIKAMRSSANSSRCYKQNAQRDDYIINDLNQFNKLILDKKTEVSDLQSIEQRMNNAISVYLPPKETMKIIPSPTKDSMNTKAHDNSDDDDIFDDHEDEDRFVESPVGTNISHKNGGGRYDGKYAKTKDANIGEDEDDMDFLKDDDDDDMSDLFRNFTAPSTSSASSNRKNNDSSSSSSSKGTPPQSPYRKVSNGNSSTSQSISFGAAGIRGIQHQQRQLLAKTENTKKQSGAGHTAAATAASTPAAVRQQQGMKMSHIKPGQAIRVRAPSSTNKRISNNNNTNHTTSS